MKKSNIEVLAVIRAIIAYCTSAQWGPIVSSILGFSGSITALQTKEDMINDLMNQQSKDIKGYTQTRRQLRITLAIVSYTYLRRGMAYAKSINDMSLYQSLKYSLSTLKGMDFNIIGQTMKNCFDILSAVPIIKLTPYGITSFTNWTDAITTYNKFVSTPRSERANKKAVGEMLDELIIDANSFLRTEVTPQAEAFVQTQPLFYKGYKANLKRIPASGYHTRLDAILTSEIGTPCPNCTVTVDQLVKEGRIYKAVSAITDINGICEVSEFESGMRTVTVSGDTIQSKTFGPFMFDNGKAITQIFICAPAFDQMPASKVNTQQKKTVS